MERLITRNESGKMYARKRPIDTLTTVDLYYELTKLEAYEDLGAPEQLAEMKAGLERLKGLQDDILSELLNKLQKERQIIESEKENEYKHLNYKNGRLHTLMRVEAFANICKSKQSLSNIHDKGGESDDEIQFHPCRKCKYKDRFCYGCELEILKKQMQERERMRCENCNRRNPSADLSNSVLCNWLHKISMPRDGFCSYFEPK